MCRAGRQFASPEAKANGYELLKVVCHCDDRLKERNLEIAELLASIKVIGPKKNAADILMEMPNRRHLRESIIERVKSDWVAPKREGSQNPIVSNVEHKNAVEHKFTLKREFMFKKFDP